LNHQCLPRRIVERNHGAAHDRDREDHEHAVDVRERDDRQRRGARRHRGLRDHENALPIPAIGQRTAEQSQQRIG
jgi:hypothetical protein